MNGALIGDIKTSCPETTIDKIQQTALRRLLARKDQVDDYLLTNCKKYLSGYKLHKIMTDVERAYQKGATKLDAMMPPPQTDGTTLEWGAYCPEFTKQINHALRHASFDMRLVGLSAAGVYIPLDFVTSPYPQTDVEGFHKFAKANIDEQFDHASLLLGKNQRTGFKTRMTSYESVFSKPIDLSQANLGTFQANFNARYEILFADIRRVSIRSFIIW